MTSAQTERILTDLLTTCSYKYKDLAKRDVLQALAYFKELLPKFDQHIYPNGLTKDMVSLNGTIPVNFKNNRYNIPIQLYLADTHPYVPPIVYVRPTSDMCINVSDTVDSNGRVNVSCIKEWNYPKSDLYMLINILSIRFSEQTPLYAKPANQPVQASYYPTPVASTQPPYPVDGGYSATKPLYPTGISSSSSSSAYPLSSPYPTSDSGLPPYASATNPYYPMPQPQPQPQQAISHLKSSNPNAWSTQSNPTSTYTDDTIKPEYYRLSLITAVEDKMRKKLSESVEEKTAEIDSLKRVKNDLEKSQSYLTMLISQAEAECNNIKELSSELKQRQTQLNESMTRMEHRDKTDLEDAVIATRPLYRQLLELFAEEVAIQDLLFYLSEGLNHKTVSLENFLKQVRFLARKQFILRATMSRAREKAALPLWCQQKQTIKNHLFPFTLTTPSLDLQKTCCYKIYFYKLYRLVRSKK